MKRANTTHYGNLAVVGLFFGISLCCFSIYKIIVHLGASDWRKTQGVVIKSEVVESFDHPSEPNVVYEYQVGGKRFTSNEIAFLNVVGGSLANKTVANYPRGKVVAVFYDPHNPARSVLEPKLSVIAYGMLAAGVACLGVWRWAYTQSKAGDANTR